MQFHIPYLKMFADMGWETSVAAGNDFTDPSECSIPYCDKYYDVPFERSPFKTSNIKAYRQLKAIIDNGGFDIVHCHTPVGGFLCRLAARKARKKGTKVIYTAHGFHFYKGAPLKNWILYYPAEKFCSRFTDVLITINKEDHALAQSKMHAKRAVYVPGVGIDTDKFTCAQADRAAKRKEIGVPENAFVILSVGELNKNKNHRIVVQAVSEISDSNIHCVIVGQGKLNDYLNRLAADLNVSDRVHFIGYRNDMAELYKMSDLFCFPSVREGLPVALMEAMACGLPVVCSKIRGNTDLIEDGAGGYLVGSNDLSALTEAIVKIYKDPSAAVKMGQKNLEAVRGYDLDTVIELMKKIYEV